MNNIKLLEKLTEIRTKAETDNPLYFHDIMILISDIENEIAKEQAKKTGKSEILKYAKQIIKSIPAHIAEQIKGICKIDDMFVVMDTFRVLILKDSLLLPEASAENYPKNIVKQLADDFTNISSFQPVELPELSKIKIFITEEKAKQKAVGKKNKNIRFSEINIDNTTINANFLCDALAAGFNKCYYSNRKFYMMDENENKTIICGVLAR